MILFDSGYLIALIDVRDALHPRALRWSRAVTGPAVVTTAVLTETLNHCSKPRLLRQSVHALVDALVRSPQCEVVHVDDRLLRRDP